MNDECSEPKSTLQFKSLYDTLVERGELTPEPTETSDDVRSLLTGRAFAEALLNSAEFRAYIVDGLEERTLPPAVLCRLMDRGWGKPPDRVEHTGKNGDPIETITEVRRVIVHVDAEQLEAQSEAVH